MKKNQRIGILVEELTNNPSKLFEAKYFCEKMDIAKSSLSEDIRDASELFEQTGRGHIESFPGVGGGIKFVPGISKREIMQLQDSMCEAMQDTSRNLGGGYLYTSDIMFNGRFIKDMARIFAQKFYPLDANYVVTVETKGIPLAAEVAFLLNIPLVVIRREARYSEGSTVSINYFSGSSDRIQKMSLAKRAVEPNTRAIIIDDFMRGGGSLRGIKEILGEFNVETVGMGVAMTSAEPEKKRVDDYTTILILKSDQNDENKIIITPNEGL